MFEVDKPRRFHYEPRFYDPEKERWEALKKKYADEQARAEARAKAEQGNETAEGDELAYFQQRVRDIEQEKRQQSSKLGWKDLFRKREMPKFNPQFHSTAAPAASDNATDSAADESLAEKYRMSKRQIKIKRRFDIGDTDYMKPVSGGKIILYTFIVFLLVVLILRF